MKTETTKPAVVLNRELFAAACIFQAEIIRLYKFGHEKEADAMFETTIKAFNLDREVFGKAIIVTSGNAPGILGAL